MPLRERPAGREPLHSTPILKPDKALDHHRPDGAQGKWSPETDAQEARLRAIPYTTPQGKTIYTVGFGVSPGDRPPVILRPTSRLRVRGRIESTHKVYVGVTLRHPNGEFAGRFQIIRPAAEFQSGRDFELALDFRDFELDPSLDKMKNKLPSVPFDLVIESFWCHTLGKWAGLELAEVELIPE